MFDENRKVSSIVLECTFEATFDVPEDIASNPKELEKFVEEMYASQEMLTQGCNGGLTEIIYEDD